LTTLLTIAGTDPSSAAGIQADLHVFRDHEAHGASVVTTVVSQNTSGVHALHALPEDVVDAQLAAVFDDLDIAAVKVGLVPTAGLAQRISARVASRPVVWDPVLTSGDGATALVEPAVVAALLAVLPLCDVFTPNAPEAATLTDIPVTSRPGAHAAAARLVRLGAPAVLLKTGHLMDGDTIQDVWATEAGTVDLAALPTIGENVRGTGCHLSSAIAARLARGDAPIDAVEGARRYLSMLLHEKRRAVGRGRSIIVHS